MGIISQFIHNKYIYIPFFTWLAIQAFKVLWDLVTTKKLILKEYWVQEVCRVLIQQ